MGFTSAFEGLMSSGSKKKEPRYTCLSEAEVHTHKECGLRFHPLLHTSYTMDCLKAPLGEDVSSGYLPSQKDCVLLKDRNLDLAPRQGPQISSRAFGCHQDLI
jgi:hypothetical protein